MRDIYYPETDYISLIMEETPNGITLVPKNITFLCFRRQKML